MPWAKGGSAGEPGERSLGRTLAEVTSGCAASHLRALRGKLSLEQWGSPEEFYSKQDSELAPERCWRKEVAELLCRLPTKRAL